MSSTIVTDAPIGASQGARLRLNILSQPPIVRAREPVMSPSSLSDALKYDSDQFN